MKTIGYVLITLSFLATATFASLSPNLMLETPVDEQEHNVPWNYFIPALGLGVVGIFMVRLGTKQANTEEALGTGMAILHQSMANVSSRIATLDEEKQSINVYDLHEKIDEQFREDLNDFAEARKTIIHVHGLDAYAEVMNAFAAGERYLNRVWSASIDGYIDEAQAFLSHARREFESTAQKLADLKAR